MESSMRDIIKKYKIIIIIFTIFAIIAFGSAFIGSQSSAKLLPAESVDSIAAINSSNIYILNNQKLIKLPSSGDSKNFQIIDSDITFSSTSPDQNKIYFTKGDKESAKSYIFDIKSNKIKQYDLYDEFFWQGSAGRFVDFNGGESTIYNEALSAEYSDLPFPSYTSYANIILGSTVTETPESQGFKWQVINQQSASFKSLSILDFEEETAPWVIGNYMLYLNNENSTTVVNNQNQKKIINFIIPQENMTSSDSKTQYFISSDKVGIININSINLDNAQPKLIKKTNISSILNKEKSNLADVKQVYYYSNNLYIVLGDKIVRISL
jgi:hypothetical protein